MTPQEAQMLQDLVRKVTGTQLNEKDPDAEALLSDGLGRDPDALYKLAQTVLIQDMALHQAQARIQQLSAGPQALPPQQPARASSFLGSLLHRQPPSASQEPPYQQVPVAPPPQQQYYQQAPQSSGGGASFLRSAATTAAGVAAGALAFQGIEDLMHGGFGHGAGFGGPMGYGGGFGAPVEETVVNNYYDDPNQGGNSGDIPGPDMQPQGGFDDASYDPGADQGQDQGFDDQGGGFDDGGGGFDDGGNDLV